VKFQQQLEPVLRYLSSEIRKYESEEGGAVSPLDAFVTKAHPAFLARAGADLSSALDFVSWENPGYLQISLTERLTGRFAGVIQLHRFEDPDGKQALLARINSTPQLARRVNPEAFAASTTELCKTIAGANGWELYFPEQEDFHALTNRSQHVAPLQAQCLPEPVAVEIDITDTHTVEQAYRVR
jgi:hypothetical protein